MTCCQAGTRNGVYRLFQGLQIVKQSGQIRRGQARECRHRPLPPGDDGLHLFPAQPPADVRQFGAEICAYTSDHVAARASLRAKVRGAGADRPPTFGASALPAGTGARIPR